MLIAWPAADHAVVIAGPHNRAGNDVYALLLHALGLDVPPEERNKPPCCDEEGLPPADPEVAEEIVSTIKRLRRARRRSR